MSETTPTREYFEAAIADLEQLAAAETDADRLRDIYSQIARLRYAMIDESFDQIVRRTSLLQSLVAELRAAIAGASGEPPLAGAITKLNDLATQVQGAISAISGISRGMAPPKRGKRAAAAPAPRSRALGKPPLRVLCVHGVGDHHTSLAWRGAWTDAILAGLRTWDAAATAITDFVVYDDLFDTADLNPGTVASAIWKLGTSGVWHGIGDLFRRPRGLMDIPTELRWTAGMVAQWGEDADLRAESRGRVTDAIVKFKPDVIAAHSLGSLIAYDTLRLNPVLLQRPREARNRTFITFGSQIANPFVRSTFAGRIEPLKDAQNWYHLFNPNDRAFAQDLRLTDPNFVEVGAEFKEGVINHDAIRYLAHPNVVSTVWYDLANPAPSRAIGGSRAISRTHAAFSTVAERPKKRALLIGINEYPDPANRLDGCVNDVFRISAALQESGFAPEDIRTVFDDRATAAGILERLHWLLDGVCPDDIRFLYYSGHGAQMPAYGARDRVDHVNECLVPYDFDWTPEHAIMDTQFYDFYSQLPYKSHFIAAFDCCHSGGMTRSSAHKVRGITPPDDVRHRMLRWDWVSQMWVERDLTKVNPDLAETNRDDDYTGKSRVEMRLGRANFLRLPKAEQRTRQKKYGHKGPYMPVLIQACQADQLSYEYRDGVTSYGAFTFALTTALSTARKQHRSISWETLVADTAGVLKDNKYDQSPNLVGPSEVIDDPIPWLPGASKSRPARKKVKA
ncbi:MAG TPA: caspase family protein [Tepidisphaeraceae bacterium]|nr:caspase family protein [Tepidisphaeraceae bacterium]